MAAAGAWGAYNGLPSASQQYRPGCLWRPVATVGPARPGPALLPARQANLGRPYQALTLPRRAWLALSANHHKTEAGDKDTKDGELLGDFSHPEH